MGKGSKQRKTVQGNQSGGGNSNNNNNPNTQKPTLSIANEGQSSTSTTTLRVVAAAAGGGWKSVPVSLFDSEQYHNDIDIDNDNNDNNNISNNHYDNDRLMKQATFDLPVAPGEDVGIFFGLEVLDGKDYKIMVAANEKKRNQPLTSANKDTAAAAAAATNATTTTKTKKAPKKKIKTINSSSIAPIQKTTNKEDDDNDENDNNENESSLPWQEVQQQWSVASDGACLDERLCRSLARCGFRQPTPIQAATLSASILGRRNLVGAAPTGSGKTLAFCLPILQAILEQPSDTTTTTTSSNTETRKKRRDNPIPVILLQALIVTPTRELATQIHAECEALLPHQCVTLVGGIAQVKQQRLLQQKKPPIVIGTPGRLWAMMSSGDHFDLSQLRFLVLDEADRMTQDHSFPQLLHILEKIHQANPGTDEGDDDESFNDDDDEQQQQDRMLGLPGIRGEAQLTMLTPEILTQIQEQRQSTRREQQLPPDEEDQSEAEDDAGDADEDDEALFNGLADNDNDPDETKAVARVHRQTFIYSATLTLPFTSTKTATKKSSSRNAKNQRTPLQGGLAEILEKTHAMGETKVVDLSTSSSSNTDKPNRQSSSSNNSSEMEKKGVQFPPGLQLEQIKCTKLHKDSHLYAYLTTTKQGASGPALVFCNSIAAVRRVGTTLQTLGFSVRLLHAHMQQRARFKAVESLNKETSKGSRAVVVCTDVAARGLDIPSVATVIHYDVARTVDTFVHRAGRTARGMGQDAVGTSVSLIAPSEDKAHTKILQSVQATFSKVLLDGRLLSSAQERVNLASKIVVAAEKEHKIQSNNQWFRNKAEEAELELDDEMLDDDNDRPIAEQSAMVEAQRAKVRLAQLLAEPMKTQRFGKFLSTNSAALQDEIKPLPLTNQNVSSKSRPTKKIKLVK